MNLTQNRKERFSNLELLRILATIFVVIVHYNARGIGNAFFYTVEMPLHYRILLVFEMLAICAVNIFVMISGFFLCTATHVKVSKILCLYMDVIFFSVLRYVLHCLLQDTTFTLPDFWRSFIPQNWYVAVYSGLYLISPYLNIILRHINRAQFRFMLLVSFFVLSVWPSGVEFLSRALDVSPYSLSPVSYQGSGNGYTLVNFILMYFLGAYCRMHGSETQSSRKRGIAILIYLGCAFFNTLYANFLFDYATSYCNPFVVIQTVAIFVAFQSITIRSKAINAIAGCSFGVYLMHEFFLPYCQTERFVTGNPLRIPIHIIVSSLLIYAACALIYRAYRKMAGPVLRWIQNKLSFLSYGVS